MYQYHYIRPYIRFDPIVIISTSGEVTTSPITNSSYQSTTAIASDQLDVKSTNVAVIAGAAAGGSAFILIVGIVVFALVGRSKQKKSESTPENSMQE